MLISCCKFLSTNFTVSRPTLHPLHGRIVVKWLGTIHVGHKTQNGLNLKFRRSQKYLCIRNKSTERESSSVTKVKDPGIIEVGEKVKQATKDASYLGVIIIGIGVTGLMFYAIFRELFSGRSPNSVYAKALERCREDQRIINACGEPVKGYGETTRRGRRRHVSHVEYVQDGINHMRMKFYVEGNKRKGTVHLEVKENEQGKYEYRYLFVDLEGYPKETIVLEDNRLTFV